MSLYSSLLPAILSSFLFLLSSFLPHLSLLFTFISLFSHPSIHPSYFGTQFFKQTRPQAQFSFTVFSFVVFNSVSLEFSCYSLPISYLIPPSSLLSLVPSFVYHLPPPSFFLTCISQISFCCCCDNYPLKRCHRRWRANLSLSSCDVRAAEKAGAKHTC